MVPRFEKRVRAFSADISGLILVVILTAYGMPDIPNKSLIQGGILLLAAFLIIILPNMLKSRQSFGKRIQKIKVVNLDGSEASVLKLLSREVFKFFMSTITFGVYLIIAYFTLTEKHVSRTIHDYIFKTKVIDLDTSVKNRDYRDAIQTKTMKDNNLR